MQLYQVKKLKTTHAIVLIFESFEIQTLAGNTAMLFLRKVQKSRKAFLKRLSKTWKPIKKRCVEKHFFSFLLHARIQKSRKTFFLRKPFLNLEITFFKK